MYDLYPDWSKPLPEQGSDEARKQVAAYYAGDVTVESAVEIGEL